MILDPDFCTNAATKLEDSVIDQIISKSDMLCACQYEWVQYMMDRFCGGSMNKHLLIYGLSNDDFFRVMVSDSVFNNIEIKQYEKSDGTTVDVLEETDNPYNTELKDSIIYGLVNNDNKSLTDALRSAGVLDTDSILKDHGQKDWSLYIRNAFFGEGILHIVNYAATHNSQSRFIDLHCEQKERINRMIVNYYLRPGSLRQSYYYNS